MATTNVLISGAGIGGPALAYWLHRYGYTVTVVERAPAPRPGGQAVDLRGEGRTAVERMGLMEQAKALSVDQRGLAVVGSRGQVQAELSVDAFGGEGIVSEIEILRGDLADLLHGATAPYTEYLFDDTITRLDQDDTGVTVTFEKAAPRRFGIVIGADGQHSTVRALAFGPESEFLKPMGAYEAWFTAPADDTLDGWFAMHRAPGGLVASLRPGRLPGETKAALAFRTDAGPGADLGAAPIDLHRRGAAAQRQLIEERFAGVGWKVPWLLAAMHTATDFAFDSIDQVEMPSWSNGRVALLGDAGYCPSPLTGLGTTLALVGAYVLAGEIATAGGDHTRAFDRYEQVMRPYVKEGHELPPMGINGFAPKGRLMIWLSAASMRWMTRWPLRGMAEKQFAKPSTFTLPDYSVRAAAAS